MTKKILFAGWLVIFLTACARMGMPEGGPKDTQPPELLKAIPPSGSVSVHPEKIVLQFNELVVLDNPYQKILISPPLPAKPEISPVGYPAHEITIRFKNPLWENTTYSIYFNDAVKDYREGNPRKNFTYVFSTGPQLDSLTLQGKISPAVQFELPGDILVGLYPAQGFRDSVIMRQPPLYLTQAEKNGTFSFAHLHEGKYRLIAFEDKNHNNTWQASGEAIAFVDSIIQIPSDTTYNLRMFEPAKPFRPTDIAGKTMHSYVLKYEGDPHGVRVEAEGKKSMTIPGKNNFTLWVNPVEPKEKLKFIITTPLDTFTEKSRANTVRDTFLLKIERKILTRSDTLRILASVPIVAFNKQKISIDSAGIKDNIYLKHGAVEILPDSFDKKEKFTLQVLPQALTDFLGHKNPDTLQVTVKMIPREKTGRYKLILDKPLQSAFIAQLTDEKAQKIIREKHLKNTAVITFENLLPGKYRLRLLIDTNENGRWDTGDYFQHKQPEPVILYPKIIEMRANWELEEKFTP